MCQNHLQAPWRNDKIQHLIRVACLSHPHSPRESGSQAAKLPHVTFLFPLSFGLHRIYVGFTKTEASENEKENRLCNQWDKAQGSFKSQRNQVNTGTNDRHRWGPSRFCRHTVWSSEVLASRQCLPRPQTWSWVQRSGVQSLLTRAGRVYQWP